MTSRHPSAQSSRRPSPGFSLTELLVVIGVISILLAVSMPVIRGYPESKQISAEADNLSSQLSYARLIAVSSGHPVEIRFYQEPVIGSQPDRLEFRSHQLFIADEDEQLRPEARISGFTGKVILSKNEEFSSILSGNLKGPDPAARELGNMAAEEFKYHSMRFLPDGSTDLGKGGDYWSLTLQNWTPDAREDLPDDFVTLQIDPFTGNVRRYEPGH